MLTRNSCCGLCLAVLLLPAWSLGEEERVLIDFGNRAARGDINSISTPYLTGTVLTHLVTAEGTYTRCQLRQLDGWAGYNTNGFQGDGPYPVRAMQDSFYLKAGEDEQAVLELGGLQPRGQYTLKMFASRMGVNGARTAVYQVEKNVARLDAVDNQEKTVSLEGATADEQGNITLTVRCSENGEFAYLGVLEVRGSFPAAAPPQAAAAELDSPPVVSCQAWAIADGKTGRFLWGEHARDPRPMASTTKMMTAWIVLDLAAKNPELLKQTVTISGRADRTGGSTAGVRDGETLPASELLYGLLLPSGNDAAVALAEHFGKHFEPGGDGEVDDESDSLDWFVQEMNRRAEQLGMTGTHYFDPHGNSKNRSTARDLLKLAYQAMQDETFRKYVGTRRHECVLETPDGNGRKAVWKNTNRLLSLEGYDGIKTGTTRSAGACLVSSGHRGDDHLLMVVLGSSSSTGRYVDSRNLYRWAWKARGHGN